MDSPDPADQTLDATGLLCPEPVFRARQRLARMRPGEVLEIRADDPLVEVDLKVFCQRSGHRFLACRHEADCRVVWIRRRATE